MPKVHSAPVAERDIRKETRNDGTRGSVCVEDKVLWEREPVRREKEGAGKTRRGR